MSSGKYNTVLRWIAVLHIASHLANITKDICTADERWRWGCEPGKPKTKARLGCDDNIFPITLRFTAVWMKIVQQTSLGVKLTLFIYPTESGTSHMVYDTLQA